MSQSESNHFRILYSENCSSTFEIGFAIFENQATDYLSESISPQTLCLYHRHILDDTQTESELIQSVINANGQSLLIPITKLESFPSVTTLDEVSESKCDVCTYNMKTIQYQRNLDYSTIPTYTVTRQPFSDMEPNQSIICKSCLKEIRILLIALYRTEQHNMTAKLL